MRLSRHEQETIINFNQAEDIAYIYTCNKSWMQHFEKRLGLKPTKINYYAREYECPKSWIRKPQKPRILSEEQKLRLSQRLHQKPVLSEVMPCAVGKYGGEDGK
ncbi:hypothetical protein ACFLXJ_06780 [Chloroflexota bacterium]